MKKKREIPNHSPEALAEEYEAALFSLAFQRIEDEELLRLYQQAKAEPRPAEHDNIRRLEQQIRRTRGRVRIAGLLPRVAQVAACLIAILSIGAGVALAASPAIRSWAAGVLTGRANGVKLVTQEPNYEPINDGVVLGDALILLEEGEVLSVRDATDEAPKRYVWAGAGSRSLITLAACDGELYGIYETGCDGNGRIDGWPMSFDEIGLGRVRLSEDGSFAVEERMLFDAEMLFSMDDGVGMDCRVTGITSAEGRIYFTTYSTAHVDGQITQVRNRLFCCEPASSTLTELDTPIEATENDWMLSYSLFGDGGEVFIAMGRPRRIFRIEPDGGYTELAEFEEGVFPNIFAYRASDDTFFYQRNAAMYAAPHFDLENSRRVALSDGHEGRGMPIGDNSFVIVTYYGKAEIFDLDAAPEGVTELIVSAETYMDDEFRAEHPNLTLVKDPAWDEVDSMEEYIQALLDGEARADVITMVSDYYLPLAEAGYGAPIRDEVICAAIDAMPEELRAYVSRDGEYVAMPCGVFSAENMSINVVRWRELGFDDAALPETWLEVLSFLNTLSHTDGLDMDECRILYATEEMPMRDWLMERMIESFARNWAAQGLAPDFGGEDFAEALAALEGIDFDALPLVSQQEDVSIQESLMSFSDNHYDVHFGYGDVIEVREQTLTIHRGDPIITPTQVNVMVIAPDTEKEEEANAYLRWMWESQDIGEQLKLDFATPAQELERDFLTAEAIERYREQVGRMHIEGWNEGTYRPMLAALEAYDGGEMDSAALAAALDEIYAG